MCESRNWKLNRTRSGIPMVQSQWGEFMFSYFTYRLDVVFAQGRQCCSFGRG